MRGLTVYMLRKVSLGDLTDWIKERVNVQGLSIAKGKKYAITAVLSTFSLISAVFLV